MSNFRRRARTRTLNPYTSTLNPTLTFPPSPPHMPAAHRFQQWKVSLSGMYAGRLY
jgi:hypothetical protein